MNAADVLLEPALSRGWAGRPALRFRDETVSYAELARNVGRAANALHAAGLGAGERVLLLVDDSPGFVYAYLGAIKAGGVAVALNVRSTPDDLRVVLDDARPRLAIVDWAHRAPFESVARESSLGVLHARSGSGPACPLRALIAGQPEPFAAESTAADSMAFWIYTSGTTGRLKAAVHRHRDVLVAERYPREVLGVAPGDLLFSTSRLFFAYALGTVLFGALRLGACALLDDSWPEPGRVADLLARERPSVVFSVPAMYRSLLAAGVVAGEGFGGVRHYVSAGERLPAALYERWRQATGHQILDGMGSSETIYMLLTNRPERVAPGSSGMPAPGAAVRLADASGGAVASGEPGVLWAKIESCATGYWGRPEDSAAAFRDGWFRTGDLYRIDNEGFWHHEGRADDMFKVAGQWVSPSEVEELALAEEGVRDAALVAAADRDGLAHATLFVAGPSARFERRRLEERVMAAIAGRLASHKWPRRIQFIEAIPRTATGKIKRYKLRSLLAE